MEAIRSLWAHGQFGKFLVLLSIAIVGIYVSFCLIILFFVIDSASPVRGTMTTQVRCKIHEPERVIKGYSVDRQGGGGKTTNIIPEAWKFCIDENSDVQTDKITWDAKNIGDTVTVEYSKGQISGIQYYWSAK